VEVGLEELLEIAGENCREEILELLKEEKYEKV